MSFYGAKTFKGLFSVHKRRLDAGQGYRFGGAHGHVAYDITGQSVPVTLHHSGVDLIEATTVDAISVILMGTVMDNPAVFQNLTLVDVADSVTLGPDVHGVVLEGSFTVGEATLDAEADIHHVEPGSIVTGTGKLATFTLVQN